MATILNIETSTTVCSVAIAKNDQLVVLHEIDEGYSHAENLSLLIEKSFREAGLTYHDLDAIAVSKGPGSYTGLRIGVSTAKGLAYSLGIPFIAINTLESMTSSELLDDSSLRVPMLDARRMEVYMAMYDANGVEVEATRAEVISEQSLEHIASKMILFGPGAPKCQDVLSENDSVQFVKDILPSAKLMIPFSYKAYLAKEFEDIAYFEPFYLKDFVAGKPKKLL